MMKSGVVAFFSSGDLRVDHPVQYMCVNLVMLFPPCTFYIPFGAGMVPRGIARLRAL